MPTSTSAATSSSSGPSTTPIAPAPWRDSSSFAAAAWRVRVRLISSSTRLALSRFARPLAGPARSSAPNSPARSSALLVRTSSTFPPSIALRAAITPSSSRITKRLNAAVTGGLNGIPNAEESQPRRTARRMAASPDPLSQAFAASRAIAHRGWRGPRRRRRSPAVPSTGPPATDAPSRASRARALDQESRQQSKPAPERRRAALPGGSHCKLNRRRPTLPGP